MGDELLDVVDANDIVISQAMRSVVHREGFYHRGIHVFLATPEGKLLVQQRSDTRETFPMALDCSVSEHVKAGETYLAAARRGLTEELGLGAVRIRARIKFRMNYGINDNEICQIYEGRVDPAEVRFDRQEVNGIILHPFAVLPNLIAMEKVKFCGWFVEMIHWYLGKPSRVEVMKTFKSDRLF
jgi:isopentenyldiphosphate isomerase